MSSPLTRLTLGRRPEQDQARAVMLSRLGIAEEKPRDMFREPEHEPSVVEALAPSPAPAPEPEPVRTNSWAAPANDQHIPDMPVEAAPEPVAEVVEDPFEAIRRQYRKQPKTLPPIAVPHVQIKRAPVGVRRRKGGELTTVRKAIWGLSILAGGTLGWALLTGDESSPIIQVFGMLLP